jgi:hypothetical protein
MRFDTIPSSPPGAGPPEQSRALGTLDVTGEPKRVVSAQQALQARAALVERQLAEVFAIRPRRS